MKKVHIGFKLHEILGKTSQMGKKVPPIHWRHTLDNSKSIVVEALHRGAFEKKLCKGQFFDEKSAHWLQISRNFGKSMPTCRFFVRIL